MSLVEQLKSVIQTHKYGSETPDAWIREWLFESELNRGRLIPVNAHFTLIRGIQILFELPWQAICEAAEALSHSKEFTPSIAPYVCVRDSSETEVLIVDMNTHKILHFWRKEAWLFRFKSHKELESWMESEVVLILKALGKEDKWRPSRPKKQR